MNQVPAHLSSTAPALPFWRPRAVPTSLLVAVLSALCIPTLVATAVAQSHTSREAALKQAAQLRAKHQPRAAADVLRAYLQTQPADTDALLALGGALLDTGERADAEKAFAAALAASPNSPAANDAVGELLLEDHHDPEAMDRFETALTASPHDAAARKGEVAAATELAMSARKDRHPEASLEVLRHACSKLPDEPQLLLDRGIQAEELGLLPEAEQSLQQARDLDPKNPTILYALARVETDEQHVPDAERDFKAYLAVRPDDASAHYGLGMLYAAEQKTTDARNEFFTSLKLQPHQTESYYQLGALALNEHDDAAASALFQKVLASAPNHAGALTGLGELELRSREYVTAEQLLAKAEQADPNYAPPHYYRGLALAKLGRKQEAEEELQRGDSRPHATPNPADAPPENPEPSPTPPPEPR